MQIVKVYFELTFLCNLKCKFCYAGDMQNPLYQSKHILSSWSFEQTKKDLDIIFCDGKNVVYDVDILWGESLLNRFFFDAISYISKNYSIRRFTLTTNATLINQNIIQKLKNSPINEVRVSLHGLEATHNMLVGKEVFQKVVHNLDIFKDSNIRYTLIYVYNNVNRNQIVDLLIFLEDRKILPESIFIEFVEFSGFALDHISELNLIYDKNLRDEFDTVLRTLKKILPINISLSNFPKCMLSSDFHHYIDDWYSESHRYELYYPRLARKSLFGFSYQQQRDIIKSNFERGYKINFQKLLDRDYIPGICDTCKYKKNCYLLTKESILYDYLGYDFLKRKSYFEINPKNILWSICQID